MSRRRARVAGAAILRSLASALCHADNPDWPRILRLQAGARALAWVNWWERRTTVENARRNTQLANIPKLGEVTSC